MIKHRFILRGQDDYRIFAAIPVERTVLKWEKREPRVSHASADNTVHTSLRRNQEYFDAVTALLSATRKAHSFFLRMAAAARAAGTPIPDDDTFLETLALWKDISIKSTGLATQRIEFDRRFIEELQQYTAEKLTAEFIKRLEWEREVAAENDQHGTAFFGAIKSSMDSMLRDIANEKQNGGLIMAAVVCRELRAHAERAHQAQTALNMIHVIENALHGDRLACPEGVPFAYYTVEFNGLVVDVIEGHARLHEATEEEVNDTDKRVVEIVSQMLTERSLNPKADTRIPVVSIDPAHERDVRTAEDRDAKAPPTGTRLRTIKFTVSPPRYLRAAAEHILSSPRKAHWVVGHWRDQAYGTAHQLRRQTWIKPHIRGLGEAGAITARVAAPD